jgi:hypothetical protein
MGRTIPDLLSLPSRARSWHCARCAATASQSAPGPAGAPIGPPGARGPIMIMMVTVTVTVHWQHDRDMINLVLWSVWCDSEPR